MRNYFSRTTAITLAVLWLVAMILIPTAVPAQAANYVAQLCPAGNSVITAQGDVPSHSLPPFSEINSEFPNFSNAGLYSFNAIQGGVVVIEVHRLTSEMDPAAAIYLGYGDGPLAPMYWTNYGGGSGSAHGVGGSGFDVLMQFWVQTSGVHTLAIWDELGAVPGTDVPYDIHISGDGFAPCTTTLTVNIDIKPGSQTNAININGNGVIPVAVLGSASFQVNQIDVASVKFARLDVRVKGNGTPQCAIDDVNS